jgi:hypothetical protein
MFVISANINLLIAIILSLTSSRYDLPELRYGFDFSAISRATKSTFSHVGNFILPFLTDSALSN